MQIYSSEIVKIGEQANLFLDEGIVVFFGDNAPEELQDFAVIHKLDQITGDIEVGTKIKLSDSNMEVVSIGPVANENFKNLGHLVLKLDSSTDEAQLGDVRCIYDKKPDIKIGDTLRIIN
jgi:PTS system glucitol/sorbitol-specific IIA component